MIAAEMTPLSVLYETDETAWLDAMSALVAQGRLNDLDHQNLSEYLADMARRDRREVLSRLTVLLMHLLKWKHQPERQSASWQGSILEQRRELRQLLESGTLYNHAVAVLSNAYFEARKQAIVETQLPDETFPAECGWEIDELLADDV